MTEQKIILIVEDETVLQKVIVAVFAKNGIKTMSARSVEEAKKVAKDANKIDAIWLDHYLVGQESGLDYKKLNLIPFYVVTNTAAPDAVATYVHFGAKEYYVKSDHRLEDIVKTVLAQLSNPSVTAR
jgi:DNA-binding NtrC family response regulator